MLTKEFVDEFIGFLEHQETRLLSWGFYDFVHTADSIRELLKGDGAPEVLTTAISEMEAKGVSLPNILDDLAFTGMLHRVRPSAPQFRTRYAESVRLIARLRQILKSSDWINGRPLVSDIKLDLRYRTFPARSETVEQCWSKLKPLCNKPPIQKPVFEALSHASDGTQFAFSKFQKASFERILRQYGAEGVNGTVVTAGTGSGKTKAFYIPAFLGMAAELDRGEFVKVIAVYPRNVLLADQLREAISEASKAEAVLKRLAGRGLTFGALTGQTRYAQEFNTGNDVWDWKRLRTGYRVPFLASPLNGNPLVWRDSDRQSSRTSLYDEQGGSTPVIPDGVIRLTRDEIRSRPPDVLFVSTEMLNRLMGDPSWDKALGIGQGSNSVRLFLLDEVHAYEGMKGAQIGWVLRRWRYWSQTRSIHFVGLSATLRRADEHLSKLAGISPSRVAVCAPSLAEVIPLGREYNLAVKGDPVSGASLLATSIQCGMLLPRLLTPRSTPPSATFSGRDLYASKAFGFTDNLDSVNRWFSDIRNADVEKRLARFRLDPIARLPQEPAVPKKILEQARVDGQLWELPKTLGHDLNQPLNITRCSSQDSGTDVASDLIVATSSLEVGYDDPEVGAILHHKHPKTISSFIQRKGRAGRRVGTRPWTVTVLSDFGADRWYFNNAERLFDPEIDNILLPLLNPYVLRSQAIYFLLDWIGRTLNCGEPFQYLLPRRYQQNKWPAVESLVRKLLMCSKEWNRFRQDFMRAFTHAYGRSDLQLDSDLAEGLLWGEPRPLLLEVIPTLLRKIEARWSLADPGSKGKLEDADLRTPLPEFIPYATFGEVGISTVTIDLPNDHDTESKNLIPVSSLYEICPGRVSKRFVTTVGRPGVWLRGSDDLSKQADAPIGVNHLYPGSIALGTIGNCTVFQPVRASLVERPQTVLDSSDGTWHWQTDIKVRGTPLEIGVFNGSRLSSCFDCVRAHLHRDRSLIQITRFADCFTYDTKMARGRSKRGIKRLGSITDGQFTAQAIGFRQYLDGIVFHIPREHVNQLPVLDSEMLSRFRADYFLYCLQNSEVIRSAVNVFGIERLWLTSVSMIVATALAQHCSLQNARGLVNARSAAAKKIIAQVTRSSGDEDPRAAEMIEQLWNDPLIREEVERFEPLLWDELPPDFSSYVRDRYVWTLAEAVRATAVDLVPELSDDDVQVDVAGVDDGHIIALTELSSGGVGYIESIVREFRRRPTAVQAIFRHHLEYCPREQFSQDVLYILKLSLEPSGNTIADVFADARGVSGFSETLQVREQLERELQKAGVSVARAFVVGLLAKILKPGSTRETDLITYLLNKARRKHNLALGTRIDPRVFGYAVLSRAPARRRLQDRWSGIGGEMLQDHQLFNAVDQSILADCNDSCTECLKATHRFTDSAAPSRSLALKWLNLSDPIIGVCVGWEDQLRKTLSSSGRATLAIPATAELRNILGQLHTIIMREIDQGYLLVPAVIESIARKRQQWFVTLALSEVASA